MRWLDVAGAPGAGKSTVCDGTWPRHVTPDDKVPPREWAAFIKYARRIISGFPDKAGARECRVILNRYLTKIGTISRTPGDGVYVNTGLAQAGLELGWRGKVEDTATYFDLMPASLGVAFIWADRETLLQRNRDRVRDRSHMVDGMERTRELATTRLKARGVRVLTLQTDVPPEVNQARLAAFV